MDSAYFSKMNFRFFWVSFSLFMIGCSNPASEKSAIIDSSISKDANYNANIAMLLKEAADSPNNPSLQQKLFNSLDSAGLYSTAIKHLNLLLKSDSLNEQLWYQKGYFSERIKDTAGALKFYRYANKIYPTPRALLSMANLFAEKKDTAAIGICNNLLAMYPGKDYLPDALFIKGVYYARIGNTIKATELFNNCIYSNYRYLEAYMEKAFILYDKKQIQAALTIFATVLKLDPLYIDGYYWQAKCFEQIGKKDSAIINYQKALTLDSSLTEASIAIKKLN